MNKSMAPNRLASPASPSPAWMRILSRGLVATALLAGFSGSSLYAADSDSDPEAYKIRFGGQFWYPTPTGDVAATSNEADISLDRTIGFNSYSSFLAGVDWHFARKHHLLFLATPNKTTVSHVLDQTITFRQTTFDAGSSINGELRNYSFAPGYRYDIIHRPGGHLGIIAQLNLLDIKASITGTTIQSGQASVVTRSASVFAPLPVFGPEGRAYFLKDRLFADGNIKGMYFFGYGNFISTAGTAGVRLGSHIDATGGYQLGSRLVVNGTSSRLDLRLTQRGPTVGLEFNF